MQKSTKQNLVAIIVVIAIGIIALLGIFFGKNSEFFSPSTKSKSESFFVTFNNVSTDVTDEDGNGHLIQLDVSLELSEGSNPYDKNVLLTAIQSALSEMEYDKVISPDENIRYINKEVYNSLEELFPENQLVSVQSSNLQTGEYRFPAEAPSDSRRDSLKSLFPNME